LKRQFIFMQHVVINSFHLMTLINYSNSNTCFLVGLVFFSYTTTCTIIFLLLARRWPSIAWYWAQKEEKFLRAPYKRFNWRLSKKIKFTATIVILLAFTEHCLFLANSAFNQYNHVHENNVTVDDVLSYFLENQFGFIFPRIPFWLPYGIFVELINLSFTFGWNYMEIFVMIVSLGLCTRFQQINQRMERFRGKVKSLKI
jgi:gustatory receptor